VSLAGESLLGIVLLSAWWQAPRVFAWWDRRRGRSQQPTYYLTMPVVLRAFRPGQVGWREHKLIEQARVRRKLARRAARRARWLGYQAGA
jgi:hypothetical protein